MAELGVVASVATLIQVTGQIIEYLKNVKGGSKARQNLIRELHGLHGLLHSLTELAKQDSPTGLSSRAKLHVLNEQDGPLLSFRSALGTLAQKLGADISEDPAGVSQIHEPSKRRSMARLRLQKVKDVLLWPLDEKDVIKIIEIIERQKSLIVVALSCDLTELSRAIRDQMESIKFELEQIKDESRDTNTVVKRTHSLLESSLDQQKRTEVLQWLLTTDASTNHNAACERHEKTTGNWLVNSQTFKDWKTGPGSFFWLYGMPGCGKTILSSTIIESLRIVDITGASHALAYYYFDFNDPKKREVVHFLRSVITQLCANMEALPDSLQALYGQHCRGSPPGQELEEVLEKVLVALGALQCQTYIVIDALDECQERKALLSSLSRLAKQKAENLHVVLTSRNERDIETALISLVNHRLSIEGDGVESDIRLHVAECLRGDPDLNAWNDSIKADIQKTLANGAKGMYAEDVVVLRLALKQLPEGLDETYERILKGIPLEHIEKARTIFRWLAYSERPLYIEEAAESCILQGGSCIPSADTRLRHPRDILNICSSLVTTFAVAGKEELRFAHFSVQEYLLSDRIRRGNASSFFVPEKESHKFISIACVSYLLLFNEVDSLDLDSFEKFLLLDYAARYWFKHEKAAEGETAITTTNVTGANSPPVRFNLLQSATVLRVTRFIIALWLRMFPNRGSLPLGIRLIFSLWLKIFPTLEFSLRGMGDGVIKSSPTPISKLLGCSKCAVYLNWIRVFDPDTEESRDLLRQVDDIPHPLYYMSLFGLANTLGPLVVEKADINAQGGKYGTPLQAASVNGHDQVVQRLLENGADANAQGGIYGTPLQAASVNGHDQVVQRLLENGANVNARGGIYGIALHAASAYGHDQIVQRLLENGADASAQGGIYDTTALQAASSYGHDQVVQRLLENGADANAQGGIHGTALQAASFLGHDHVVRRLLENGADFNAQGGKYGTALQAASVRGYDQVVQRLLENGADANAQGGMYGAALQAASAHGHGQTVQRLLENGADANAQVEIYGTALQTASVHGHDQVVQRLLENGADANAQGGTYGTALQAASFHGHDQVVRRLLENGADVNAQGGKYGTALQAASVRGYDQVVQRLLENGADANAQGGMYGAALQAASAYGHGQTVQRLLENGADANAQVGIYGTALQTASVHGRDQVVQRLLENGASVNAQGGVYSTALQAASAHGHDQIVQWLLENGAEANAQVEVYGTALQTASVRGHDQVVQRLLENGADANAQGGRHGAALQAASAYDRNRITIQRPLEDEADTNAQGGIYGTALQAASSHGYDQIVRRLLENGADANAQGGKYGAALQAASAHGHGQIVQRLLENGAKVNAQGGMYGTALQAASVHGHDHIAQKLKSAAQSQ